MNVRRSVVPAAALASLLTVIPTSAAVAQDVRGTAGPDVLVGTRHDDRISAGAGDDTLVGKRGNDRLVGDRGGDVVKGGPGLDRLSGGHGEDRAHGGPGQDSLSGGRHDDFLFGEQGKDRINGGPARDSAYPGPGGDLVRLGGGRDQLFVEVDGDPDVVDCGDGEDTVAQVVAADPADTFVHCEHLRQQLPATPDSTAAANGRVFALAAAGDRTIVGGSFTRLGAHARDNVGALLANGTVDPRFVADTNGEVEAVAVSADGSTLFIGGTFTTVNGVARANLAAVDALTGAVWGNWSADTAGSVPTVHSLAVHGDRLYVAGKYTGIDGTGRSELSALDTASGDVIVEFDPRPNGLVREVVVTPDGNTVFAGGGFSKLGGTSRLGHAGAVDATDGTATTFDPVLDDGAGVVTVALSPDGSRFFLSTQRNRIFAFDWATSNQQVWMLRGSGNMQAIAASNTEVYIGGHWARVHGLERPYLGSLDLDTGRLTSWDTRCSGSRMGVWALLIQGSSVHVGGVFDRFGREPQRGYARFTGTP